MIRYGCEVCGGRVFFWGGEAYECREGDDGSGMSLMMGDDGEAAVRHLYLTHAAAEQWRPRPQCSSSPPAGPTSGQLIDPRYRESLQRVGASVNGRRGAQVGAQVVPGGTLDGERGGCSGCDSASSTNENLCPLINHRGNLAPHPLLHHHQTRPPGTQDIRPTRM